MADSQGQTIVTISVIFGALSVFAMALRLLARVVVLGKIGLDDSKLALPPMISSIDKKQS